MWLTWLPEVGRNLGMAIGPIRDIRTRSPRAMPSQPPMPADIERYALMPLRAVQRLAGDFQGRDVLELGPGDNLVSGLAFVAAGARSYAAVERFASDFNGPRSRLWYRALRDSWQSLMPDREWPDSYDPDSFPEAYADTVRAYTQAVEDFRPSTSYDFVCSFQVGEHVSDVGAFARLTAQALKPDGTAVHRIDFGPHGRWSSFADPLTFLRVPDRLWRIATSHRGMPNRLRCHDFIRAFEEEGLRVEIFDRTMIDAGTVDITRLPKSVASIPTESLLTLDAVFVCRKVQKGDRPSTTS